MDNEIVHLSKKDLIELNIQIFIQGYSAALKEVEKNTNAIKEWRNSSKNMLKLKEEIDFFISGLIQKTKKKGKENGKDARIEKK